ncbi:protein of unknown function [Cupriavidus taiwanensis]|nr:protein of unknown function [Cupriavidus taiwanensis]
MPARTEVPEMLRAQDLKLTFNPGPDRDPRAARPQPGDSERPVRGRDRLQRRRQVDLFECDQRRPDGRLGTHHHR